MKIYMKHKDQNCRQKNTETTFRDCSAILQVSSHSTVGTHSWCVVCIHLTNQNVQGELVFEPQLTSTTGASWF